jgi:cyclophilin family peptidyl-prolyl cis-trans isomerase
MIPRLGVLVCVAMVTTLRAAAPPDPDDSEYTGLPPTYPRATPVVLPSTNSPPSKPRSHRVDAEDTPKQATKAPAAPAPPPPTPPASEASPPVVTAPPSSPVPEPVPSPVSTNAAPETAPSDYTPPPSTPAPAQPPLDDVEARKQVVVLETTQGRMVIELDDVAAPRTCGNFRKLVSSGFYNHTLFHRIIPGFMIQGGDPITKTDDEKNYGKGDPGYTLPAEIGLKPVAGAVAMARLPDAINPDRDSNGSQFFICVADCPSLEDQYTIFGHVVRGLDTAARIASQPRDAHDTPRTRIEMQALLESKKQAFEENPK